MKPFHEWMSEQSGTILDASHIGPHEEEIPQNTEYGMEDEPLSLAKILRSDMPNFATPEDRDKWIKARVKIYNDFYEHFNRSSEYKDDYDWDDEDPD